jgi:para-aminobenzoate synthetase/4-amino-4-deoxychorismate lyase
LRGSAEYFGFALDETKIRDALRDTCSKFSDATPYRLRLALQADDACVIQTAPLSAITSPVKILLAETPTDAGDIFLRHKTTIRTGYDAAWRAAEQQGAFDQLFCNQDEQLTEGGRSTVFIKLDGHWYTPPLSVGVLPGVMRAVLLEDATLNAEEKILTLNDLRKAEEVVICNALRGTLPATIVWNN